MKSGYIHTTKNNTGSVLVITVIFAAVLFGFGIALATILQKEIISQSNNERSNIALNIVHTALECVLYNDFRRQVFNESVFSLSDSKFNIIDCGPTLQIRSLGDWETRYQVQPEVIDDALRGESRFSFVVIQLHPDNLQDEDDLFGDLRDVSGVPCAHVIVQKKCVSKKAVGNDFVCDQNIIENSIEIRGYFSCSEDEETSSELVRRVKVHYN